MNSHHNHNQEIALSNKLIGLVHSKDERLCIEEGLVRGEKKIRLTDVFLPTLSA